MLLRIRIKQPFTFLKKIKNSQIFKSNTDEISNCASGKIHEIQRIVRVAVMQNDVRYHQSETLRCVTAYFRWTETTE